MELAIVSLFGVGVTVCRMTAIKAIGTSFANEVSKMTKFSHQTQRHLKWQIADCMAPLSRVALFLTRENWIRSSSDHRNRRNASLL